MMKKQFCLVIAFLAAFLLLASGCAGKGSAGKTTEKLPADGVYEISVTLSGGTGRASVASPAKLVIKDGRMTAELVWSSKNYDYMLVDEVRYEAEIVDGHSVFNVPVSALDTELAVIADTTAMSVPHEIEYTLQFDSASIKAAGDGS